MTINEVKNTIKKHLYIVFKENFTSDSNTFIERYVAKHPLLKPELIVINDQIQGFKKASKKVSSLEDFPIFLEIEGLLNDEESCYIDGIDLYAEANVNCQKRLSDIIYLSKMYAQHVSLERVLDISNVGNESLIITSKVQDQLMELTIESEEDNFIEMDIFNKILSNHLTMFCHIIQVLNDLIIKDHSLAKIENSIGYFPDDH